MVRESYSMRPSSGHATSPSTAVARVKQYSVMAVFCARLAGFGPQSVGKSAGTSERGERGERREERGERSEDERTRGQR